MRRLHPRLSPGAVLAALAAVTITVSCTEEPLPLGIGAAPGASTTTRDVTVPVTVLPAWRDTTVSGFALPSNASFVFLSSDPAQAGRTFGLFNIPDTIRTFGDTLPVDTFDSVTFMLRVDTIRSQLTDLPLTFRVVQLEQPFDADSVTWMQAAPGTPWNTPGGDLGVELASGQLEALSDSVLMGLSVSEDSLMKAWQDKDGDNGVAVLVEGPPARVRLISMLLRYEPTLEGRALPVPQTQGPEPRTFVVSPPLPDTDTDLRLGGLPASRFYVEFAPPESLDGISLEGVTINHAALIFHPLPAPPDPFSLELALGARQVTLLGDPFVLGPKTPIGSGEAALRSLAPELLEAGAPLELDITLLIGRALRNSTSMIRLGLRGDPDAQTLGFWEFGSMESPPGVRPELRIVFSTPPGFTVP